MGAAQTLPARKGQRGCLAALTLRQALRGPSTKITHAEQTNCVIRHDANGKFVFVSDGHGSLRSSIFLALRERWFARLARTRPPQLHKMIPHRKPNRWC